METEELIKKAEEYITSGQYVRAQALLENLLQTDTNNIDALNDLGVVEILKEENIEALNTINRILLIDPFNEIAKENLKILNNIKGNPINPEAMKEHCNYMMKTSLNENASYHPGNVKQSLKPKKTLKEIIVLDPTWSYETFQSFYMDRANYTLKPNVVILRPPDMDIVFEINSHGFKGKEINPAKKLIAVWGDSCVMALERGWVEGLDDYFENYQFLNGGVEGDGLPHIIERALAKNLEIKFSHNIIYPGWHSRKQPDLVYELLTKTVKVLPGPMLCTIPISLSERIASMDISGYFVDGKENNLENTYLFAGNIPYSVEAAQQLVAEFKGQNQIIRKVAEENKIPLIDLYNEFYVDDLTTFREDFFDVGHPRVKSFPKWHKAFYKELKNVLV